VIRAPLLTSLPFMPIDADLSGWSLIYLVVLSKYGFAMFHGGTGSLPKALMAVIRDDGNEIITSTKAFRSIPNEKKPPAPVSTPAPSVLSPSSSAHAAWNPSATLLLTASFSTSSRSSRLF
jgi:phytoene dehydrogenase-like protein